MAYVRKTDTLWQNIRNSISQLFVSRINYASDWSNYGMTLDEINTRVLRALISDEERLLMDKLGKRFFVTAGILQVNIHATVGQDSGASIVANVPMDVALPNNTLVPKQWTDYGARNGNLVADPDLEAIATKRQAALTAINNEHQAFINTAKKVWDSVGSVNSFVKAWPPGMDLLPNDAKETLREKRESSRNANAVDPNELQNLSASLLKARVAQ